MSDNSGLESYKSGSKSYRSGQELREIRSELL